MAVVRARKCGLTAMRWTRRAMDAGTEAVGNADMETIGCFVEACEESARGTGQRRVTAIRVAAVERAAAIEAMRDADEELLRYAIG
jgi:hypothetical protein